MHVYIHTEICMYVRSPSNSRINGTPVHTEAAWERRKNFISDLHSAQRRVGKRGELQASNWKACKEAWNGKGGEWGMKVNKPPVCVKGSSEACTSGEKIAFHLDTHDERVRRYREGRGFNKKFESGSRDFADDRPSLGDRRESRRKGVQSVDLRGSEGRTSSSACGISSNPLGYQREILARR